MEEPRGRGMEALFGSRARVRILGFLAQASAPVTAYGLAKRLGLGFATVYPELRRLEGLAIVASSPDRNGSKRYRMADEDLRAFLVKRVRFLVWEEWFSPGALAKREAAAAAAEKRPVGLPPRRGRARAALPDEFYRPPEKDRALKRMRAARRENP